MDFSPLALSLPLSLPNVSFVFARPLICSLASFSTNRSTAPKTKTHGTGPRGDFGKHECMMHLHSRYTPELRAHMDRSSIA